MSLKLIVTLLLTVAGMVWQYPHVQGVVAAFTLGLYLSLFLAE